MRYGFDLYLLLLAALSLGAGTSPASAQQTPPARSSLPERPQSSWATQCNSVARDEPLACSIEQRIVLRDTGQQLARVSIQIGGAQPRQPALLVQVPLGLSIRSGISLQVDQAERLQLDVQTCDASGCYAGNPVSPEFLGSLKKGNLLKVAFEDLQSKEISVQFSLAGFTTAYSKVE